MYRRNIKLIVACLTLAFVTVAPFGPLTRAQGPGDRGKAMRRRILEATQIDPWSRAIWKNAFSRSANGAVQRRRSSVRDLLFREDPLSEDQPQSNDQPRTKPEDFNADSNAFAGTGTASNSETQKSNTSEQNSDDPNHTIVAYSTVDDGPGSLRQALREASDGDKINVTARGTITLISGELVVDKSLTIRGPGKANLSINGNAASRVFYIAPGTTVTIEGIKIMNGRVGGFRFPTSAGGGVYSDHAQLTLRDCVVSGNAARFGGGVFSNSNNGGSTSLTLVNTSISGNSAEFLLFGDTIRGFGGGIFSGGGFISANPSGDATLSLDNSIVSGNTAAFGGGIFSDGFSGNATATINNSSVTNNTAFTGGVILGEQVYTAGGGGIYNNGDSGVATLRLTGSTITGNVAGTFVDPNEEHLFDPGDGGGIYNDAIASVRPGNAQVTLNNTAISGNTAFGDSEGSVGGGIVNYAKDFGSASVTADGSNIKENAADICAIFNFGEAGEATVTVTGSSVNANVSTGICNGRAASESQPGTPGNANLTLANTVLSENSGGAISNSANLQITSCDITDNLGGGISTSAFETPPAFASISNSIIRRNRGGVANFAARGFSTLRITNSTIRENQAVAGGGIANIANNAGQVILTVDKSTVSNNHAGTGGGLLNDALLGQAFATLTNSTLSGNSAEGEAHPEFNYGGGGGVLNGNDFGVATVDLTNCTLSGNSTDRTGGAIANHANPTFVPSFMSRVTLNNSTLSGNSAAQGGNSIWNKSVIDDEPCTFPECIDPGPGVATVDFANTIFDVGNLGGNFENGGPGIFTSRGYNLSSDAAGGDGSTGPGGLLNGPGDIRNTNPMLDPLQDNGGPTLTHALPFYSTALNAGDPNFNPNAFNPPLLYDQRGGPNFPRVVNGRVDIGAYELKYP